MATKNDLKKWVYKSLESLGGSGSIVNVAKAIWQEHELELKESKNLFYTWQYDMRWAAHILRKAGTIKPSVISPKGVWELK